MNISTIGAGYVGLITGLGFAQKGHNVICIDIDKSKVSQINQGKAPIYEIGLDSRLAACVKQKGNLKASLDYNELLNSAITFICVDTPSGSSGSINLSHVIDSAIEIGRVLAKVNKYQVIVVKSTVIPGTTEHVIIPILEKYSSKKAGKDFGVAVNPEFLQEGKALYCFLNPDRITIGEYNLRAGDMLQEIYRDFPAPVLRTTLRTAEMIKYASNAFLATKISFINEIGNICKKLGIDVYEVARGMGYDPRIGNKFLNAGIGFGGDCLPKDLQALIFRAEELGYKAELLQSVLRVNREQPLRLVEIARKRLGSLENKVITILGLGFKPDTNDVRHAPALKIIPQLLQEGATVKAYDPKAIPNAKRVLYDGIEFCKSSSDAIADSDCILIITDWDEFKDENLYAGRIVIDGRRTLDPEKAGQLCQYYEGVCW